ncbi:hypothetical protein FIU86_07380 [Roseovarius sp. THAF9]|uniref:hypothetical protein n=1 Tax=Roseovarius sp. THAF9 TaxID=2587847 RepID=UPI0012691C1F|nr:hypothetical protein [Roseovarius sp. THAF9]QFT92659.1 hypothetical protein FIU86_07380 [Roseovarius sp. THAF9]
MKRFVSLLACTVGLSACDMLPTMQQQAPPPDPAPQSTEAEAEVQTAGVAPPANARTADEFDTTTEEERAAAVQAAQSGGGDRDLGTTVASLGAAADSGIWMKTPLVDSPGKGRVEYPAKGTTVAVDLIPLDAEPGSGSQLSLAAMRLLEADLTGLPEVRVFATGG